jgi:tricorn protease
MMLGELNASHLGFSPSLSSPSGQGWKDVTPHLGIRWDRSHPGPGLRILDIVPGTPADRAVHELEAGGVIAKIDGKNVGPGTNLAILLNGRLDRNITLTVVEGPEKTRDVTLRPIAYTSIHNHLYNKWIRDNLAKVERASDGTLGYLHVRSMNWTSFLTFERELYSAGAGKDGLVIDVRENGGGFTADYLLTALTQPLHAITVGRGGGPGYPQDRKVYASWNKPIVVLCNQNSFSNAEIFAHAIKTLKRGKVVGVRTAGGVISTSHRSIMDLGNLRTPLRGWYVLGTGEDMERNGAVPDVILWPAPGDMPAGRDEQLTKAIEVLSADVRAWKARPRPKLRKASERGE